MGYDINLFLTEIEDEFQCPICLQVLQDAVVLDPCQHAFCSDCIRDWRAESSSCPVDQVEITGQQESPLFINLLNNLMLHCPFAPGRCPAIISIGELPHHRNWCRPARRAAAAQSLGQLSHGSYLPLAGTSGNIRVTLQMVHKIALVTANWHGTVLKKWGDLVPEFVERADEQQRIYGMLKAGDFSEAIKTTLELWRASHCCQGNGATLNEVVWIFRKYQFLGLSDEIQQEFASGRSWRGLTRCLPWQPT